MIDRCVQLFGGYGYMLEYPIARLYADARVSRIYAGSNEIMKEIVGRSLLAYSPGRLYVLSTREPARCPDVGNAPRDESSRYENSPARLPAGRAP